MLFSFIFFSLGNGRRIAGSVVKKHLNRKRFFQILDTECVAGKRVLTMCHYNFPRMRIEGKEGVSEIRDVEQVEQLLANRTK